MHGPAPSTRPVLASLAEVFASADAQVVENAQTTVTLEVSWTSNIGSGSTLEPISRTASQAVEVGEIQAIGTGG